MVGSANLAHGTRQLRPTVAPEPCVMHAALPHACSIACQTNGVAVHHPDRQNCFVPCAVTSAMACIPLRWQRLIGIGRQLLEQSRNGAHHEDTVGTGWDEVELVFTWTKRSPCDTWARAVCRATVFKAAVERALLARMQDLRELEEGDALEDADVRLAAQGEVLRGVHMHNLVRSALQPAFCLSQAPRTESPTLCAGHLFLQRAGRLRSGVCAASVPQSGPAGRRCHEHRNRPFDDQSLWRADCALGRAKRSVRRPADRPRCQLDSGDEAHLPAA